MSDTPIEYQFTDDQIETDLLAEEISGKAFPYPTAEEGYARMKARVLYLLRRKVNCLELLTDHTTGVEPLPGEIKLALEDNVRLHTKQARDAELRMEAYSAQLQSKN